MPKQHTTGTINAADTGSLGLALAEKIRDDVALHPAWEIADDFTTDAGSAGHWYVLRCLASASGLPADFFVVIARDKATGTLRGFMCEGYDVATKVCSGALFVPSNTNITFDAQGRSVATYTLGATLLSNAPVPFHTWALTGISEKYWIIADDDAFTVAVAGGYNGFWKFGTYEPVCATPIPMPLMSWGDTSSWGAGSFFLTRNPEVAGMSNTSPYACNWKAGGTLGFAGNLAHNDALNQDRRTLAQFGMIVNANAADRAILGWALGKQKNVRVGNELPAGLAFGDSFVLNGTHWVQHLLTSPVLHDTGVAAA